MHRNDKTISEYPTDTIRYSNNIIINYNRIYFYINNMKVFIKKLLPIRIIIEMM